MTKTEYRSMMDKKRYAQVLTAGLEVLPLSQVAKFGDIYIQIEDKKVTASFTIYGKHNTFIKIKRELVHREHITYSKNWFGRRVSRTTSFSHQDYYDEKSIQLINLIAQHKKARRLYYKYLANA